MQSRSSHDLPIRAPELGGDAELSILRDVFRMLPGGVTVQDEHGRFLLVNDAAATLSARGNARSVNVGVSWRTASKPNAHSRPRHHNQGFWPTVAKRVSSGSLQDIGAVPPRLLHPRSGTAGPSGTVR